MCRSRLTHFIFPVWVEAGLTFTVSSLLRFMLHWRLNCKKWYPIVRPPEIKSIFQCWMSVAGAESIMVNPSRPKHLTCTLTGPQTVVLRQGDASSFNAAKATETSERLVAPLTWQLWLVAFKHGRWMSTLRFVLSGFVALLAGGSHLDCVGSASISSLGPCCRKTKLPLPSFQLWPWCNQWQLISTSGHVRMSPCLPSNAARSQNWELCAPAMEFWAVSQE